MLFHVKGAMNDVVGEKHRFDFPAVAANAERAYDITYDCFKWAI